MCIKTPRSCTLQGLTNQASLLFFPFHILTVQSALAARSHPLSQIDPSDIMNMALLACVRGSYIIEALQTPCATEASPSFSRPPTPPEHSRRQAHCQQCTRPCFFLSSSRPFTTPFKVVSCPPPQPVACYSVGCGGGFRSDSFFAGLLTF